MRGGKHLLLLAAFAVLVACKPQVFLSTPLHQIFTGDLLYLTCNNIADGSEVTWFLNNINKGKGKTLKVVAATTNDSGDYQCESNGEKSDIFPIKVEDFVPSASLSIETGQPVVQTGDANILKIEHDDGLQGWNCSMYKGGRREFFKLMFKEKNPVILPFPTADLDEPETIFWCSDFTEERRSNQVVVRTSGKLLALEMKPMPAIVGENLTLRCLVWGSNFIKNIIFYKGNELLQTGEKTTYEISGVKEFNKGQYSCRAKYQYVEKSSGPPYDELSHAQDLPIQDRPRTAVLSDNMTCSCPECPNSNGMSYRFYEKHGESWTCLHLNQKPDKSGTFQCRMVLGNMRTLPSQAHDYNKPLPVIGVLVFLFISAIILVVAGIIIYRCKRRSTTAPIYEDVGMRSMDKGDDKYEPLQRRGREAEYDAIQKKGGEYEGLKKDEMKDAVYHTLGPEGAAGGGASGGGEGGYEALKKEGMKDVVYHTLGSEGGQGGSGEGGYEALKKQGMKEGVYHTLGADGGQKGEGKTDDEKESEIVEL